MIGWVGSILLALCGLPELIRTVKDGRCHVGWGMLLTWFFGEVFVLIHVISSLNDLALVTNYTLNIAILSVMIYYKFRGSLK